MAQSKLAVAFTGMFVRLCADLARAGFAELKLAKFFAKPVEFLGLAFTSRKPLEIRVLVKTIYIKDKLFLLLPKQ